MHEFNNGALKMTQLFFFVLVVLQILVLGQGFTQPFNKAPMTAGSAIWPLCCLSAAHSSARSWLSSQKYILCPSQS